MFRVTTTGILSTIGNLRLALSRNSLQRQVSCKNKYKNSKAVFHQITVCPKAQIGRDDERGGDRPQMAGTQLLAASTLSYAAMTILGVYLGDITGVVHIPDLVSWDDWKPGLALLWTAGLLPYPIVSNLLADRVTAFGEIRTLFQETIVPTLEQIPVWGLGLLAVGAGVGEETFFRGFLQTAAISGLADAGGGVLEALPQGAATWIGVGAVSLFFGALHAATPVYFYFATAAGALFGIEFLTAGLPAAAATHTLYDFVALVYIVREWGGSKQA